MEFRAAETLILNNEEFVMMLSAAGITQWYGIDLSDNTDFVADEKAVNACLAGLYRKGLVEWGEKKARLSDSARQIFGVLRNSPVCIKSSSADSGGLTTGSYCSDGVVVVTERGMMDQNEIKLTLMGSDDWISMFRKSGCFPKVIEDPGAIDIDQIDPDAGELISEFEVRSIPGGKMLERLQLLDCGVYGMLIQSTETNSEREIFTTDRIKSIMRSWAGGSSQ